MKWNRWGELVREDGRLLAELVERSDASLLVLIFWPEKTFLSLLHSTKTAAKLDAERYITARQKEAQRG